MLEELYLSKVPLRGGGTTVADEGYIRQCLDNFKTNANVIQFTSAEFTGPLHFMQFWLDVVAEWEKETGQHPLIALSACKDVQDAILADPVRAAVVDVIDLTYWFRTDKDGKFLWPGFGQNMRVIKWVVQRIRGQTSAVESPIGWMPRYEDLDWNGLSSFSSDRFYDLMSVDREHWRKELMAHEELFSKLYDHLPKEFVLMREPVRRHVAGPSAAT